MKKTSLNYSVVSVLWNDPHIILRAELPNDTLEDLITPTVTVGILYKQTKDFIVIIHTAERHEDFDEADYTVIFSGCIISIKKYGKIKLKLRPKGAN